MRRASVLASAGLIGVDIELNEVASHEARREVDGEHVVRIVLHGRGSHLDRTRPDRLRIPETRATEVRNISASERTSASWTGRKRAGAGGNTRSWPVLVTCLT